jgi:hypothetical protein
VCSFLISPMRATCNTNNILDLINLIFAFKENIYEAPYCSVCFSLLLLPLIYMQIFPAFPVLPLETKTIYTPTQNNALDAVLDILIQGLVDSCWVNKRCKHMAANSSRVLYALNRFMNAIFTSYYRSQISELRQSVG